MDKREFIKKGGAAAILLSLGVSLESCTSKVEDPIPIGENIVIDLNNSNFISLKTNDGWALDSTNRILLVNVNGVISAFSSVCPHSGCSVDWGYSNQKFVCFCHNSTFSNDGIKVSGPANKGLTRLTVQQDGDILTIG